MPKDPSGREIRPIAERKEAFAEKQAEKGIGVASLQLPFAEALGEGPPNRHGLPKLPIGQRAVPNWAVLDLGVQPEIARDEWRLVVDGLTGDRREHRFDIDGLLALPQIEEASDFHCVTTWSKFDLVLGGVRFCELARAVDVDPRAKYVLVTGYDQDPSSGEYYTTNVTLEEAMKPSVLLVHSWEGAPLPKEHGGPVRMVTPELYAWKGAKWISRITFLEHEVLGFWERRGYSNTANPWRDDRYSGK